MSRTPRRSPWWRPWWALSLMLAGCATTRPVTQPVTPDQQRLQLQQLQSFSFSGRVAVSGQDSFPSLQWKQRGDAASLRLTSMLGVGSMQVEFSPGRLRLQTSRGEKLVDDAAENALRDALGFVPPLDCLRYWVLGVPAPVAPVDHSSDDPDGLLQSLVQQGWQIRYTRRQAVGSRAGGLQLPARLEATRDTLRLRLVIEHWHLK